jgi:hypothetical protein
MFDITVYVKIMVTHRNSIHHDTKYALTKTKSTLFIIFFSLDKILTIWYRQFTHVVNSKPKEHNHNTLLLRTKQINKQKDNIMGL